MNPDLDLTLHRIIRAPREIVWRAWTDPERLAQWWLPPPAIARIDQLDLHPAGAFVSQMSQDGVTFEPHVDATFLAVEKHERLVWTNAIDSTWRPAAPAPVPMTAEITFTAHADGTDYRILVRHGDRTSRAQHAKLGFVDGWGTTTEALAQIAESEAGR